MPALATRVTPAASGFCSFGPVVALRWWSARWARARRGLLMDDVRASNFTDGSGPRGGALYSTYRVVIVPPGIHTVRFTSGVKTPGRGGGPHGTDGRCVRGFRAPPQNRERRKHDVELLRSTWCGTRARESALDSDRVEHEQHDKVRDYRLVSGSDVMQHTRRQRPIVKQG
jgi:hypothetical protein